MSNDLVNFTASTQSKTIAALSHIGGFFTSFVAPLIIYLVFKTDPEARFGSDQAKESLNFQITLILAYIACFFLAFFLIGFLLFYVVALANFILCVVAAIKSGQGVSYRYPCTLRFVK